ncbi:MAG: signal peptidase II [Gammaproteobacteria bacterium]|nr:signal peptidase II [Gammaproteobacteria bacterium]MDP7661266.1 signal peptidase II [Gammaproteobacteria bacterium]
MPENNVFSKPQLTARHLVWLSLSLSVVAVDQLTKWLVIDALTLYQRIPILPVFDLVRLHNTGAAFSFLSEASGWQNGLFTGVAFIVSVGIVWWLVMLPSEGRRVLGLGLALVLGGAIGNVIDRLLYGYVIDFILFYYKEWSYPAFNIADSAITCGVILILYDGFVLEKRRSGQSQH